MTLAADLHIHTALSPCAAEEMTPPAIVRAAEQCQLAMIAICDHNAAGNTAAVQAAARGRLAVLAGMEITTAEEVHVIGLFPDAQAAGRAGSAVQQTLPPADDAYYQRFGPQYVLDADGTVTGHEPKMLAMRSTLALSAAVALIHEQGGLAIAAHINRPSFSVLSQLGVFPQDAGFDAVEVFSKARPPASFGLPVVRSSDSHYLADIGSMRTTFRVQAATFDELVLALRGSGERAVACA
jgi:predicted metal-dependent phosphoesterase TrpH